MRMGHLPFYLVDVFSDQPLRGNPLALVPDGERVDEATMRRVAREFNQSETTFLLPPTRAGADWRLRSFTPSGQEVFGAGHNCLGAWWWLAESGRLDLGHSGGKFIQQIGDHLLPVKDGRAEFDQSSSVRQLRKGRRKRLRSGRGQPPAVLISPSGLRQGLPAYRE